MFHHTGFGKGFKPEYGFVSFFQYQTYLRDELSTRPGPVDRSVIRSDRGPGSQQMFADYCRLRRAWERFKQANDPKRKLLRAVSKLFL